VHGRLVQSEEIASHFIKLVTRSFFFNYDGASIELSLRGVERLYAVSYSSYMVEIDFSVGLLSSPSQTICAKIHMLSRQ
jgi:hypothetical protein